jgi:hypothetical protein
MPKKSINQVNLNQFSPQPLIMASQSGSFGTEKMAGMEKGVQQPKKS